MQSSVEKELLAVQFGCQRFHQFVYGSEVTIISDHKPLESIMKKPLSKAPDRIQRMLLRLQRYNINLLYKPGRDICGYPLKSSLKRKWGRDQRRRNKCTNTYDMQ